jgi:alpha-methylacyl-CoA racemase
MGPLEGVRIVEFAGIGPAPFCGMLMADLGADVTRLERPEGGGTGFDLPPETDLVNRGKRSAIVDLKQPRGVGIVLRLLEGADALIEGYRPGVMERLQLGPDVCLARNPRLVYGRMTGWGQTGPLAERAGHDIDYIAVAGALHPIGRAGGPPVVPLNFVGDLGGGALYLAMGLLAALLETRRSGRGQIVDAAVVDGAASLTTLFHGLAHAGLWTDRRGANVLDGGCPWYDSYETQDGKWIAIGPIEPRFYATFLQQLGLDANTLPGQWDVARWAELREAFAARFRQHTRGEWEARLAGCDACVAPVLSFGEAADHPHARARETYLTIDGIAQPAPAPRFSRTPGQVRHGPPRPGEHTVEVLREVGLTFAEIEELEQDGAVFSSR